MCKILLFTDCLGAGGAQRQLVGLAIMLKEKGYDVKVSTYYNIDFYKKRLDDADVINELIPGADNTKMRFWAVKNYFKKERPDWVIAYQETPSLVACVAKLLGCKFKLLVSERNTTQEVGMNERIRFFLYHWADAIVPNSYSQENYLAERHPWMSAKLKTITNFVDVEEFRPIHHQRRPIPEILIAASIWTSKNTLGLIRSLRLLKDQGIKCHVSWYGKSELNIDYFNQCFALIKELNVEEYIDLLPKTNEIHKKYQDADYFCLPSFYEGTPNVLCEAISCGLPAVVSNVCDNAIYAQAGRNAQLFNPNDHTEIAEQIQKMLLQTDEEYQRYRIASREIAINKLSSETFISKYLQILRS